MKKLFVILSLFFFVRIYGQVSEQAQYWDVKHVSNTCVSYKLYPTFNRFNFLNLDTRNGSITIVQYDVQGNNEFEYFLGYPPDLNIPDSLQTNGRFELYPTRNNFTFLLLDQLEGTTYHVQWSTERDKRFITKIPYAFGQ